VQVPQASQAGLLAGLAVQSLVVMLGQGWLSLDGSVEWWAAWLVECLVGWPFARVWPFSRAAQIGGKQQQAKQQTKQPTKPT